MPLYQDIFELKSLMELPAGDTSMDRNINFFNEYAATLIEETCNRPGMFYKSRTEYYDGTGTQKLLLRSRPVFTTPTIQVYVDESAMYGQNPDSFDADLSALTWGEDFGLVIDQDNGTSRSGILVRNNALWPRPMVRQAGYLAPFVGTGFGVIKVVYTAGYTVDTLPADFRLAAALLVTKMAALFPMGLELTSESYEDRSISWGGQYRNFLMGLIRPILSRYRNYRW